LNKWQGERITLDNTTDVGTIQAHIQRYTWALSHCVDKNVLDVGCGIGYGTHLLGCVTGKATGIDISPEAIEECKDNYWNDFFVYDIEQYEADHDFDVVIAFEVIEHVEDMQAGITNMKKAVAEDGTILMSMPIHQGENKFHHGRDYSCEDWIQFIDDNFDDEWERKFFYQPLASKTTGLCIKPLVKPFNDTGIIMLAITKGKQND
jgi:SAM-dependent methyltransferase